MKMHSRIWMIALGLVLIVMAGVWRVRRSPDMPESPELKRGPSPPSTPTNVAGQRPQNIARRPVSTIEEIPNYLLPIMAPQGASAVRPKWDFLSRLTPRDRDLLNAAYLKEPELVNRSAMIWVLGFVGDERTVNLLQHTLTLEFAGQKLTMVGEADPCEEPVMLYALESLGLLAARSDSAFAFLKQGIDPQIWKSIAQWQSSRGADSYGILAGRCIQALGMSGRPEVEGILLNLREADLVNRTDPHPETARTLYGAAVDAAFYHDFIKHRGVQKFHEQIANGTLQPYYEAWRQTERGKDWRAWADAGRAAPR